MSLSLVTDERAGTNLSAQVLIVFEKRIVGVRFDI